MTGRVQIGFEGQTFETGLDKLLPTRSVRPEFRKTRKFAQIRSSIREIGLIEPLIVTPPDPASMLPPRVGDAGQLHTPECQNRDTFFLTVLSSGG